MSISKNNCLYEHATLVGAVQDATLKNYHKVSASHVSKSRKEDLGYDKFSSNMKYLVQVYPSYSKISVNNLTKKAIQLKSKVEKTPQKNLLKIPEILAKAIIAYRKLYTVGATTEDMTSLLEKEDFHKFLAQDLSEYMKREKPPKKTSSKTTSKTTPKNKSQTKRGRKPKKEETVQSTEASKAQVAKEEVSAKKTISKTRRGRKPKSQTNTPAVVRLYEVTLRDGSTSYISGKSMLLALGVESVKNWDVLNIKEMGTLYS